MSFMVSMRRVEMNLITCAAKFAQLRRYRSLRERLLVVSPLMPLRAFEGRLFFLFKASDAVRRKTCKLEER